MSKYQIKFREKGGKRFFNLSHRKLTSKKDALKLLKVAKKDFPDRKFKL